MDYETLLDRAYSLLPEKVKEPARFEIPKVRVEYHGRTTVITNFKQLANYLRRDVKHMAKFFSKELATSVSLEGDRLRLKGRIGVAALQKKFEDYVKTYVLCPVCGKPDTHFEEMYGVTVLKCEACGAISPIPEL
jgi:translation initiation factor 2 subunit 2